MAGHLPRGPALDGAGTPEEGIGLSRRPLRAALLVTAVVLVLTADERYFGLVPDGRIMVRTAVSMVTLGEIGIARGQAVGVDRPAGDSVTRYGIGPSLTLTVPTFLAGFFEREIKPGTSQTLYILHQILFLLAAMAGAGALARAWGGDERTVFRAALAAVVGSPLLAYAGADFSEPLQAALVTAAFAAAASAGAPDAAPRRALLLAAAAGAAGGGALLSKSVFILVLPVVIALVAIGGPAAGRLARSGAALGGWLPFAALWLVFEIVRFGRPFASYIGERFSHPPLDGLWRLTIGPNKGLFLYYPLALLSLVGFPILFRKSRIAAISVAGFAGAVLVSSAAWWAWDGTFGWGPRLLLPLVPVLAVLAALAAGRFPPAVFRLLFGLSVAVNLTGVLQPDIDTMKYSLDPAAPGPFGSRCRALPVLQLRPRRRVGRRAARQPVLGRRDPRPLPVPGRDLAPRQPHPRGRRPLPSPDAAVAAGQAGACASRRRSRRPCPPSSSRISPVPSPGHIWECPSSAGNPTSPGGRRTSKGSSIRPSARRTCGVLTGPSTSPSASGGSCRILRRPSSSRRATGLPDAERRSRSWKFVGQIWRSFVGRRIIGG